MSEKRDALDAHNIELLKQNGVDLKGKKILDVGAGTGDFLSLAKQNGAEVWGVDHNAVAKEEAYKKDGTSLTPEDMEHFLVMPFSQVLDKRPDLKGTFDVIKITAVTPYMDAKEMRHVAHAANQLLKKNGCLLIELPWDINPQAFRADQSAAEIAREMSDRCIKRLRIMQKAEAGDRDARDWCRRDVGKNLHIVEAFGQSYRKLIDLHFENKVEIPASSLTGTVTIIAKQPREKIPAVRDVAVNFAAGTVNFSGEAQRNWKEIQTAKEANSKEPPPAPKVSAVDALLSSKNPSLWQAKKTTGSLPFQVTGTNKSWSIE